MAKRRVRTVFHYKIDEVLCAEDREAYRTLALDPRTTNQSAHAWLTQRGYTTLSLSAVARHRRRLVAAEHQRQGDLDRIRAFASIGSKPGEAPDFAHAAEYQLQAMVFDHLMRLGEQAERYEAAREAAFAADGDPPAREAPAENPVTSAELLRVCKLVAQCVNLTAARLGVAPAGAAARKRRPGGRSAAPAPIDPPLPSDPEARDAALVARIQDILGVRRPALATPPGDPAA